MVVGAVPEALFFAHLLERRSDGFRINIARDLDPAFID
jgi:hypothetical protein